MTAGGVLFRRLLVFAAVCLPVFALDRRVKSIIMTKPDDWQLDVNDYFTLVNARNDGIAFGLFAGGGQFGVWFFSAVALLLFATLVFCAARSESAVERAAMALMAGGAIGNVYDRLRFGYVVDFADAHLGGYHWPAFNIADAAISIGALLWITLLFWRGK